MSGILTRVPFVWETTDPVISELFFEDVVRRLKAPTHFQKFIEQAEGITAGQVVVTQPFTMFANVTWFNTSIFLSTSLPVTVTAFPLQLLCSFFIHKSFAPAGNHTHEEVQHIDYTIFDEVL